MHPKTEIRADLPSIQKVLDNGWVGQWKIHGHRAQIHIPDSPEEDLIAYNRQGTPHQKLLPPSIAVELRRLFRSEEGWTVLDAEWIKPKNLLFVFDLLRYCGKTLNQLTFLERWEMLPRDFISPHVRVLPLLRTTEKCMSVFHRKEPYLEGLVFKSTTSRGFSDTSIVRCRKPNR